MAALLASSRRLRLCLRLHLCLPQLQGGPQYRCCKACLLTWHVQLLAEQEGSSRLLRWQPLRSCVLCCGVLRCQLGQSLLLLLRRLW